MEEPEARQKEVRAATLAKGKHYTGNGFGLSLGAAAGMWPTPMAGTPAQHGNSAAGNNDFSRRVDALIALWGTPRASDAEKGGPNQSFGAGGQPLPAQAAQWPTPAAQNVKGSSAASITRADGKSRMDILHYRAEQGFSRPAPPTRDDGAKPSEWRPISRRLFRSATSSVSPTTLRRWLRAGNWRKRRLNPAFVEWLMAWPSGHALCACSGMGFTLWQQDMRGALSALPMASGPWIWLPPAQRTEPEQMGLW